MLKNKLLTLGGAISILAIGACFLPPPQRRSPQPPRALPPQLQGIRTIHVIVIDNSIPAHLDTAGVAADIVRYINTLDLGGVVRAHAGDRPADADLQVSVLNEIATLQRTMPPTGNEAWDFDLTISATLKNHDGSILSQKLNAPLRCSTILPAKHSDDVWSMPAVRTGCNAVLRFGATQGILF